MLKNITDHIVAAYCAVFKNSPAHTLTAVIGAAVVLWLSVSLSNAHLFTHTSGSDLYSLGDKLLIIFTSFGTFFTNFTLASQVLILITAILAGINMALIMHYVRKRASAQKAAGTSLLGILIGFIGIGCASCGSVVLSSLIGVSATAGVVNFLPLHGAEFALIGIAILLWASWTIIKKINGPNVC